MRLPVVVYSTMGRQNPGMVTLGGGYRYKGDPDWEPGDPRYREQRPHPNSGTGGKKRGAGSHERREERLLVFAAALQEELAREGVSEPRAVREAGKKCGVGWDTARQYKRLLEQREAAA